MIKVYIAAGSNLDPEIHLRRALQELERRFGTLEVSPAYRNPAAVGTAGPDFINLAVGFKTGLELQAVHAQLRDIEAICGRNREAPKGSPHTLDLDILLYGQSVNNESGLQVPRPELTQREYVLKPMADIAPDIKYPVLGKTMRELWEAFDSAGHEMTAVII